MPSTDRPTDDRVLPSTLAELRHVVACDEHGTHGEAVGVNHAAIAEARRQGALHEDTGAAAS